MSATALTIAAAPALLMAPIAAILVAARRRGAWLHALRPVALAVLGSGITSTAATAAAGADRATFAAVQITLLAAAAACAGIGALCAAMFDDVLDAAGAAAATALTATFGLLVLGETAARLPTSIVNAALTASPLVSMASAANIDLLRDPTWYRLSPIAHRSFTYPVWQGAAGWYAALSLVCLAGSAWLLKRSS